MTNINWILIGLLIIVMILIVLNLLYKQKLKNDKLIKNRYGIHLKVEHKNYVVRDVFGDTDKLFVIVGCYYYHIFGIIGTPFMIKKYFTKNKEIVYFRYIGYAEKFIENNRDWFDETVATLN